MPDATKKVKFINNKGFTFFTAHEEDCFSSQEFYNDCDRIFYFRPGMTELAGYEDLSLCGLVDFHVSWAIEKDRAINPWTGQVLLTGFSFIENDGYDDLVVVYPGGKICFHTLQILLTGNTKPDCSFTVPAETLDKMLKAVRVLRTPHLTPWVKPTIRFDVTNFGDKLVFTFEVVEYSRNKRLVPTKNSRHEKLGWFPLLEITCTRRKDSSWKIKRVYDKGADKILDLEWQNKWLQENIEDYQKQLAHRTVGDEPIPENMRFKREKEMK